FREGFQSPVRSANLPEIRVGPLDDGASRELLDSIAADLDHPTRRMILGQALGNPLALIELSRAVREQGTDGRNLAIPSVPLTQRLERAFSAQAERLPKLTQTALLLIALDNEPILSEVLGATRIQAH